MLEFTMVIFLTMIIIYIYADLFYTYLFQVQKLKNGNIQN